MKQLQMQSVRFNKLTTQWSSQLNKFHTALKVKFFQPNFLKPFFRHHQSYQFRDKISIISLIII